jgi:3-deoxy-D-manno-octulosonic-acid transferase
MTANRSPAKSKKPPVKASDPPSGAAAWAAKTLYNAAWYPLLPIALMLSGGRAPQARRQRLGRARALVHGPRKRIWLHAASVGEIEAVRPIAMGLLQSQPGAALTVTTMTATGCEAAARRIPGAAACWLAPLDHPLTVRAFLAAVAPHLVLIAEAELWPNYFIESRRAGAAVALVNGRMSPRSLKRYRLMRPLWESALHCADLIGVQSQSDADRFLALGAPRDRIVVTGNTKFGPLDAGSDSGLNPALQRFAAASPTLIAGSTAAGEEEQVLAAFNQLRERFALRLVLAPRHLERVAEIEELVRRRELSYVKATALKAGSMAADDAVVLLLDTLGDLRLLYQYGTLAFVGGSLFEGRGGQNLGEPAAAGLGVLFGPFHQKQQETAQALLARGGGEVVRNAGDLARAAARLLGDEPARRAQGARAREVYLSLTGGAARTLDELRTLIGAR